MFYSVLLAYQNLKHLPRMDSIIPWIISRYISQKNVFHIN